MKIIITDIGNDEDNYYTCECEICPDNEGNIHSYINAYIRLLQLQGFLNATIKSGLEQGVAKLQGTLDVDSSD